MAPTNKTIWDTAVTIFFVFNAIGMLPVFVSVLIRYDQKKQIKIIVRELVIALVVLLAFIMWGGKILNAVSISPHSIGVGGGLLLVLIALNMIFPKHEATKKEDIPGKEPFIIPLAIPGLAGPGSIAAMMIYSNQFGILKTSSALIIAWIPSIVLILLGSFIKKILGEKGLFAIEKLGGMLICLIGVEMFTKGVIEILRISFPNL